MYEKTAKHRRLTAAGALLGLVSVLLSSVPLAAWAEPSLEQRVLRLERLNSADKQRQQLQTIDALKAELADLRGQVEQMNRQLDTLRQRQRSLYQDMDRRMNALESGGSGASTPAPVSPPASGGADIDGKGDYTAAFSLLKEGKYADSITAFEAFLKKYPKSQYADNARYWLGEANYVSRRYKKALADFERLIALYPDSSKVPGARLKIGYVYFELKNWSAAREALQKVVKLYPGTTVAKKASDRLARMKREGH